ncbi:MAG: response regulator [Sedimentisphaerales bacterium]|nr:response regulator [Sedimentisphaerales bacterium]
MISNRTKWIFSIGLCFIGLVYMGLMTWWNIHQLETMLLSLEANTDLGLPIRLHAQNTFFLMGCFAAAVIGTAVLFHRLGRHKAHLDAHQAIGRLNDELQSLSLEREQAVQHLRNDRKRWREIVLSLPQGIFWKDMHSVFQGCNPAFARLLGFSNSENIVGKTDYDLEWGRTLADHFVRCDKEVLRTGIALLNLEIRHIREDGKELHLLVSKVPMRQGHRVVGLLGACVDISAQKQVWQEVPEEKQTELFSPNWLRSVPLGLLVTDEQERIIAVSQQFVQVMHLNPHTLYKNTLEQVLPDSFYEKLASVLCRIRNHGEEEGSEDYEILPYENYEIRIRPTLNNGRYSGVVITMLDITDYLSDTERARYTGYRTGKYLVSLGYRIRTAMNSICGFTNLLGQDNLTQEQRQQVKMINDSAGNLLQVAQELVELAQSENKNEPLESDIDSKKAFSEFNATETENGSSQLSQTDRSKLSAESTEVMAGSVLIVDDVEENRMLLEVLLQKVGYRITHAANGQQAIERAQQEKFDVILMDMQMPLMGGLDATRQIRSIGLNQSTPILAMTASIARGDELACLEAGCDDYVRKPIKKDLVLRKVWRFVQQTRQIQQAQQGGQITSFLAEEADYHKAIESFVSRLPERIQEMQQDYEQGLLNELSLKVHSFKGLGSFAGFPIYTEKAKSLETFIADKKLDQIRIQLDELVELCRRTQIKTEP